MYVYVRREIYKVAISAGIIGSVFVIFIMRFIWESSLSEFDLFGGKTYESKFVT